MKHFSLSIITIFFLSHCKTETTCPEFNNNDLQYIAYQTNDSLIYKTDNDSTFVIKIDEINKSESFSQKCERDLYNQCPCINSAEVMAKSTYNTTSHSFLKMEQSDVSEMQYFNYKLKDFSFEIDFDNELQYANDFPFLDYLSSISVNSVVYYDVAVITNLDNSKSSILKVYLNKSNGIIQFEDKFTNVWKLTTD